MLLFLLVIAAYHIARAVLKEIFKVGIAILVWRLLSGAHWHGERRTDAGWFSHGTTTSRKYDHGGFLDRWEHKPRAHRALWRLGCFFGFLGTGFGLLVATMVTVHAVEALIVYGLVVLGFIIESRVRLRVHNRHVINPIVKSLATQLRISEHAVRRLLHIKPGDIKDEGEVGYLELPPEITPGPDQKTSVERIIDAHLPVDTEMEWMFQQSPKIGVIRAGLKPPVWVPWNDLLAAMAQCKVGDVVLGLDRHKHPYEATFTGLDAPHWGFCVESGSGKSNFLGIVSAQILHQDPLATVSVIDPKRVSLIDFLGSPVSGIGLKPLISGVSMANNPLRPQDMRAVVHNTYELMERRALLAERDRTLKFPIHLLLIDELNMFADIMLTYWRSELAENRAARNEDRTIPELGKDDPMWGEIRAILRMGRFTNIHMLVVSQDLRDDAFGGKGARNYLGFRGLGSYNKKQYDMLVGTSPYPVPQKGIGRWLFVNAGEQAWVQITHGDEESVYAYAAHGRELYDEHAALALDAASVADAPPSLFYSEIKSGETDGQGTGALNTRAVIVGLREAARHLGMKPDSFRKARDRWKEDTGSDGLPGEFRQGRSPAWYADDLDAWYRSRPRAGRSDSDD